VRRHWFANKTAKAVRETPTPANKATELGNPANIAAEVGAAVKKETFKKPFNAASQP
jgi:hypothetical protein